MATPVTSDTALSVNPELPDGEFGATGEQQVEASTGCLAAAARAMKKNERSELVSVIVEVQADLAKALDEIRSKRARIGIQRGILNDEVDAIGKGSNTMRRFHGLAAGAIGSCPEAASASADAKSASDLVYSKGNELQYRLGLLDIRDAALSSSEARIASARGVLDKMSLAMEQA
jgi:hypothetical protein